jgi:hypothetical protein
MQSRCIDGGAVLLHPDQNILNQPYDEQRIPPATATSHRDLKTKAEEEASKVAEEKRSMAYRRLFYALNAKAGLAKKLDSVPHAKEVFDAALAKEIDTAGQGFEHIMRELDRITGTSSRLVEVDE